MPGTRSERRAAVAAGLLLLGVGAAAVAAREPTGKLSWDIGDEIAEDPRLWRAARPLVIAVGGGDRARAVAYLRRSSELMRKVNSELELDEPTARFRDAARASLEDFDLDRFHELLPERVDADRRFAWAGEPAERSYRVQQASGDGFEVRPGGTRRGFGEASGVVAMRAVGGKGESRYRMGSRGGAGVGVLRWSEILDGARDAARILEEPADPDPPLVLEVAESYLEQSQPDLGPEDRRALALLWASFPQTGELSLRLGRTEDVIAAEPAAPGVTAVSLAGRWHPERVAREYPDLAEYLEGLGELVRVHARLVDGAGHELGQLRFDSADMRTRIDALISDGHLVPRGENGPMTGTPPVLDEMVAHIDARFMMYGVWVIADDLRVELRYRETEGGAVIEAALREQPRIFVEGALFGLVPTGMVDFFIPGDMEGLARQLFRVVTEGNAGRGATLAFRFDADGDGRATIDGHAEAELLHSALIRLGMAIVAERVLPDADQQADIERLAVASRDAFDADLERFATYGRVSAP